METEKKDLLAAMEQSATELERTSGLFDLVKAVVAETQSLAARVGVIEQCLPQLDAANGVLSARLERIEKAMALVQKRQAGRKGEVN